MNIKLTQANERLEQLSITDSLTGLLNRRKFDEIITMKWEYCKRYEIPLSVIMMDIDLFKQYNDYFGHQLGDDCLINIAEQISKLLRNETDYAARYGGDEFIMILTHTRPEEAYQISEMLRKKIGELHIPLYEKGEEYVTISSGVCSTIPNKENTIAQLIFMADRALYQAKSQSRNNSVAYEL